MTKEQEVIVKAFNDGKEIECRFKEGYEADDGTVYTKWEKVPSFRHYNFDFNEFDYRIVSKKLSLYEEITLLNDLAHKENNGLTTEQNEALRDVVDYADGCYVNHCEEVGKIAIENIEEMKQDWLDEAYSWFIYNAWSFAHSYDGQSTYNTEMAFDCFKKHMEKNG